MIRLSYDKEGDILDIKFSEEEIVESEYIEDSGMVLDYDKDGMLVGLEVLSFSRRVKNKQDIVALET